ncbi:MAG: prepilin-type N-terminal cleavage/methylation domain-containing protein [Candidatus Dadabacteria bacterium]|nr:MAG: prepilin-type N-terminal cleavage/methylation domain-containing protein [Candidatus Dadabacteria bacterium]
MNKASFNLHQRGFTLIEVILAITILTLIVVTGYSVVTGIGKSKDSIEDRDLVLYEGEALSRRLKRELQNAYFQTHLLLDPALKFESKKLIRFYAKPQEGRSYSKDSFAFLSLGSGQYIPGQTKKFGLVQIYYHLEPLDNRDTFALVRDEIPYIFPQEKAFKKRVRFEVSKNVLGIKVRLYNKHTGWVSSWDSDRKERAPTFIVLTLYLRSPRGKVYPFIVPVSFSSALRFSR